MGSLPTSNRQSSDYPPWQSNVIVATGAAAAWRFVNDHTQEPVTPSGRTPLLINIGEVLKLLSAHDTEANLLGTGHLALISQYNPGVQLPLGKPSVAQYSATVA